MILGFAKRQSHGNHSQSRVANRRSLRFPDACANLIGSFFGEIDGNTYTSQCLKQGRGIH